MRDTRITISMTVADILRFSSVSEGLLRNVIVFFFASIDELDSVGVLPSCEGLLSLLVSDEGLGFIDIITFTISESEMISLVSLVPHGGKQIRNDQVEQLRHVNDVQKLGTIADIEPHPVSVGLQADGLKSQELQEIRTISIKLK